MDHNPTAFVLWATADADEFILTAGLGLTFYGKNKVLLGRADGEEKLVKSAEYHVDMKCTHHRFQATYNNSRLQSS